MTLILASGSRYRQSLLERLQLPFSCQPPDIDETPLAGESAADLATRLAREKALAVARGNPAAVVIGSDQCASVAGTTLGKPGNAERARAQLTLCSGRRVVFHTAVCVVSAAAPPDLALDTTTVTFRNLSGREIDRYLALEEPWDCAGSFRCEGLGPVLFDAVETRDPNALIGLPLILLAGMLRNHGIDPLSDPGPGSIEQ